jgi:hypothetical protein
VARGDGDPLHDPLTIAAVIGLVMVGIVALSDIVITGGKMDPAILGMFVYVFGPLTPALIMRSREDRRP